jgi:transcriptional regulator GlxA family with amidase domain
MNPGSPGAAFRRAQRSAVFGEPRDDRLRAITGILRADPGDPRTLAQLGRVAGSSERTLSRLFRAQTGMSFPQWRAQFRLQAALIELTAGTPVATVAYRCGYSTPSASHS